MKKNIFIWAWQNRALLPYCMESFLYLTLYKFLIVSLPHKYWRLKSTYFQCETLQDNIDLFQVEVFAIQRALKLVARYVPWPSKCLDQALAAQKMLTRRGLANTLYLGMIKDENLQWAAHAWVRCGDQWVIGYQPEKNYTVVGTYASIREITNL